jgi:hypothetical protein
MKNLRAVKFGKCLLPFTPEIFFFSVGTEEHIWALEVGSKRRLEKLHNQCLHDLYFSVDNTLMMKSRRMKGAWHWHVWWREEMHTGFYFGRET